MNDTAATDKVKRTAARLAVSKTHARELEKILRKHTERLNEARMRAKSSW